MGQDHWLWDLNGVSEVWWISQSLWKMGFSRYSRVCINQRSLKVHLEQKRWPRSLGLLNHVPNRQKCSSLEQFSQHRWNPWKEDNVQRFSPLGKVWWYPNFHFLLFQTRIWGISGLSYSADDADESFLWLWGRATCHLGEHVKHPLETPTDCFSIRCQSWLRGERIGSFTERERAATVVECKACWGGKKDWGCKKGWGREIK